jgi:hypothetical protein
MPPGGATHGMQDWPGGKMLRVSFPQPKNNRKKHTLYITLRSRLQTQIDPPSGKGKVIILSLLQLPLRL